MFGSGLFGLEEGPKFIFGQTRLFEDSFQCAPWQVAGVHGYHNQNCAFGMPQV